MNETDLKHLARCVELATEAVEAGEHPPALVGLCGSEQHCTQPAVKPRRVPVSAGPRLELVERDPARARERCDPHLVLQPHVDDLERLVRRKASRELLDADLERVVDRIADVVVAHEAALRRSLRADRTVR